MWVLVTGALGYIGSHVTLELCLSGINVIALDCRHAPHVMHGLREIIAIEEEKRLESAGKLLFMCKDLLSNEPLRIPRACDAIIHLAALKSVSESVSNPLKYHTTNINCLLSVLDCAQAWGNKPLLVFSSSATVYGDPQYLPLDEIHQVNPVNPYGSTKVACELIANDVAGTVVSRTIILRYFNPVGAHPTALLGEEPEATPMNLMPLICRVASGRMACLKIFGRDWDTEDGTAVRDYLHVMDLATAHVAAVTSTDLPISSIFNLGRGCGISVEQMINTMRRISGQEINTEDAPRRDGDVAQCYASAYNAKEKLGWEATRGLNEMCRDAWNFEQKLRKKSKRRKTNNGRNRNVAKRMSNSSSKNLDVGKNYC